MALNFPDSPSNGQTYTDGDLSYTWNGTVWKRNSSGSSGSQNLFSTIAVSGQSNVVADSSTDTVTFAAGSNMTISTNSGSDTITFAAGTTSHTHDAPAIEVTQRTNDYTTTSTSYQTAITRAIDPTTSGSTLLIVGGGLMAGYRQDDYDDPEVSVPIIQLYRGSTPLGQEMKGTTLPNNSSTGYYRIGFNLTFKDTNNHGGNSVTYYLKIKRDSNSDHKNVAIFRGTTLTVQEII